MVASLHTGYDTGYLTDAVGTGADYYLGAEGEPPGYWQGAGARALGLSGQIGGQDEAGKASAEVMRRLYHEDIGPDGQVLGRRQRKASYPAAGGSLYKRIEAEEARQKAERGRFFTPEAERALRLKLRSAYRTVVPLYDLTYSAPKSVSVLWASLLAASAEAEAAGREADAKRLAERAAQVRGAVKRANDRMIAVAERELAYVRTGHHSKTSGEWRDAEGFIVASFEQHDSRDGLMQLHVHNAIANRVQRADKAAGGDGLWRALHGYPLFRNKLRLGTLGDRFLAQELELAGFLGVLRADGAALEVGGISDEAVDEFSTRSKELRDRARELEAYYEAEHGHAPGKRARWAIRQWAATDTRASKDHNPPPAGQQVAAWARKAERSGIGALSALHEAAGAYSAEHQPGRLPGDAERARIIRKAVAATQLVNATFDRSQLTFELGRVLPPLPAGVDPEEYLNGLVDEAVSGRAEGVTVLQVSPAPDVIDISRLPFRKDGGSIYRAPAEERFCTSEHRDTEAWLVDAAVIPVPRRVTEEAAAAALDGTDLDWSQRQAAMGLLTSGRLISCLVAPAGTGKTHVMARFAEVWREEARGRVIGLTASENAARVMAGEGMDTAVNIARFLGKIKDSDETCGHVPVYAGDVLVVDEATQVGTADALRIVQIARRAGATVIAAFDPEQLGAVDAGGIFPLIAARHGSYRLTEVRRFRNAWERDASLRLREGDIGALAEYDARGRVYHGPRDRVYDDAVALWLSDFLRGQDTLLLAASNEEAAELARLARERLAELGRVGEAEITLADGNRVGRGDLVRARLNTRIDADGQTLANRDVVRIESITDSAFGRLATVRRQTGPDHWSRPFFAPVSYLEKYAETAYAGNVHVAQGQTVDTGHLVVSEGMNRSLFYTGMTRGRDKNTIHVVTGLPDPAQPTRAEREAYTAEAVRRAHELRQAGDAEAANAVRLRMPDWPSDRQLAPWEAVLAQALQRDDPERTALEEIQAAQDFATNTGYLLELVEAFWRLDVVPKIDEMVRQRIGPAEYERYLKDPERPAFLQLLREHEIGGRRIEDVLDSITAAPLDGLRSIAAGLHGRAGKEPAPDRGKTAGWAERSPRDATPEIEAGVRMLDARQAALGERLAANPPEWALASWGDPRSKIGAELAEWMKLASIVESYREAIGITDPKVAIGPVPSGKADLGEAYLASVRALRLPDEAALLRAMGQGELERTVDEYDRAAATARPDVQAEVGEREAAAADARTRADIALGAGDTEAAAAAEAEAEEHAAELSRLSVADAARREWAEAHAGLAARAEAAERELRERGLAGRIPAPDAETETETEFLARLDRIVNGTEAEPEAEVTPEAAEPASGPVETEAEFQERLRQMVYGSEAEPGAETAQEPEADAAEPEPRPQTHAEVMARIDEIVAADAARETAEARRQAEPQAGEPEPEPERSQAEADSAEIDAQLDRIGGALDRRAGREAERLAELDEAAMRSAEAEAQASAEAAWQPGTEAARDEAAADFEAELEM